MSSNRIPNPEPPIPNPPSLRGRFAPSPTGEMHLGNARTALLAWLQMREAGGTFVLRLEDLDVGRVRTGAADLILRDLEWLGLDWDEAWDVGGVHTPYVQSQRSGLYEAAARRLETYPCTCSRREVLEASSAPHGAEPRYPGLCRNGATHPGRQEALRFVTPDLELRFVDGIAGEVMQNVQRSVGDFVIRRNDGAWAYQLACVVDDLEMSITDVLRGADLLESTPRQLLLYDALNARAPRFWHVPLMMDYQGQRLAKRDGAPSVRQLREGGANPRVIVQDLASSLGWNASAPCQPRDLLGSFGAWVQGFSV
jgi:glutamyl-queuosine tRNA(Asp) synthetase